MAGKYVSRVCVIHNNSHSCLYDRIWPGDEEIWLGSNDEKFEEDEYAMGIKFAVSGTKKERMMRQELISLLTSFFQISRSIDNGSVFKAAFQKPAENRQSNFTVKFTPHFGTLARPKKAINTKISSMVFGQAQTEMVMASKQMPYKTRKEKKILKKTLKANGGQKKEEEKIDSNTSSKNKKNAYGEFVCAVFYGVNCKPEIASNLAQKLIDEFFVNFQSELQKLLIRLDRERADNDDSSDDYDESINDELGIGGTMDTNNDGNKHQEYIMAQFKSFDEIAVRMATRLNERRERQNNRKNTNRRPYQRGNKQKNKQKNNNKRNNGNNQVIETKSEQDDDGYD